ncbi:MAG: hypothetical protein AUF79_06510 [Crenarchaeota archaeon 13_1_20CM_2_51_8]|nr:MAG: hypothetical protein AUF79_06510 [Crenarchaeota archaeon 13_1_20CM_2_51_8]
MATMNVRIGKRIMAALLVVVAIAALGQSAHAQPNISTQSDRASYVPGDSGTLTVTLVNPDNSNSIEVRNITVYFPWAQYVNGAWPSGANVSQNLSPWPTLGSVQSGNNIKTFTFSFTIPSWFAGSIFGTGSVCPNHPGTRYGTSYRGCVIVGYTANPPQYQGQDAGIAMALPTYTPTSIVSQWLPIATLIVLVVATLFLAMAWTSLRRMSKK